MARFKERNLKLDDGEKVVFGTSDDNEMKYVAGRSKVMVTDNFGLSAYPPVEDDDLIPKKYADDEITGERYQIGNDSDEPTGFVNYWNLSVMSFDDATRTFTIEPTGYPGGTYNVYLQGRRFAETGQKSVQISDDEGLHFIYFERLDSPALSANLVASTTLWNACQHAFIAAVHWDVTNQKAILFGEERHGITMDCATHDYLHNTVNTRYRSGLTMTTVASGTPSGFDGTSDDQAEVEVTDGKLSDEDILIDITNSASPTNKWEQVLSPIAELPVFYRTGALGYWRKSLALEFPLLHSASEATSAAAFTFPAWNDPANNFALTESTSGYYIASWVIGTNDTTEPVAAVVGQREDSSLEAAQNGNSISTFSFGTFPFTEFKLLYRVIFKVVNQGNVPRAKIQDIEDFRVVSSLPTGQPVVQVHGSLDGREESGQHPASAISTDQSSWSGLLSGGANDDVQKALDSLDDHFHVGLSFDVPETDLTTNGITVTVSVSANDTGFGAALFRDTDAFYEADASDISTMPCHVLATEAGTGEVDVLILGFIRDDTWAWTPGDDVYVDTDLGELTQTQPSVSGDIIQTIGWAYESNIIFFDRDKTTVEVL